MNKSMNNDHYKNRLILSFCMLICFPILCATSTQKPSQEFQSLIKNIRWVNNACVKISGAKTLYFDPYRIEEKDTADIILITHDHSDHFSMADINKVKGNNTVIVAPSCVTKSIDKNKRAVKAGDVIKVKGIKIQVVPSYNLNIDNHAKYKGYVGFIITMDGVSYYHPGDSDVIPEMKKVKADVAFLSVCGTYMMNVEDAVKAADIIKPKVVIPFHWGSVFGTKADAEKFKSLYSGQTVILEMRKEKK